MKVDINCPECGEHAVFNLALTGWVPKSARSYFEKHKSFETRWVRTSSGWKHLVLYFPGLRTPISLIEDLPDGVSKTDFESIKEWREKSPCGVAICPHCGLRRKHALSWPQEAYFKIEYKGQELWAYDRKMALKILKFIDSDTRKKSLRMVSRHGDTIGYGQDWALRRIPTHFLKKEARPHLVRKLRSKLGLIATNGSSI